MLDESTTDGMAIHGTLLLGWQGSYLSPATVHAGKLTMAIHACLEGTTLAARDRRALAPKFVGSRAGGAFGPCGGVGFGLSGVGIAPGPAGGPAVARRVLLGACFQRTDAGFDGPIVTWPVGG